MSRLIDATELNGYKFGLISPYAQKLFHAIINNTPTVNAIIIPEGATNGDMIKAMFPNVASVETLCVCGISYARVIFNGMPEAQIFDLRWWNAPYKVGGKANANSN